MKRDKKMSQKKTKNPSGTSDSTRTPPPQRAVRLKTLSDLRRFGAITINQLRRGEITESVARAYGYLLSIMSGLIQTSDLEVRIARLEKELDGQK